MYGPTKYFYGLSKDFYGPNNGRTAFRVDPQKGFNINNHVGLTNVRN
jgi:hypothetical protein